MVRRKEAFSFRPWVLRGMIVFGFLGVGCQPVTIPSSSTETTTPARTATMAMVPEMPTKAATATIVATGTPGFTSRQTKPTLEAQMTASARGATETAAAIEACRPDLIVAFAGTSTFGNMIRLRGVLGTEALFSCLSSNNLQIIGDSGAKTTAVISDMQEKRGFLTARTSHFFTYVGYNNLKYGLEQGKSVDQVVTEAKNELTEEMKYVKGQTAARRYAILIVTPPISSENLKRAIDLYNEAIINDRGALGVNEVVDIRNLVGRADWDGEHMSDCTIENVLAAQINLILNPGRRVQILPCPQKTPNP